MYMYYSQKIFCTPANFFHPFIADEDLKD